MMQTFGGDDYVTESDEGVLKGFTDDYKTPPRTIHEHISFGWTTQEAEVSKRPFPSKEPSKSHQRLTSSHPHSAMSRRSVASITTTTLSLGQSIDIYNTSLIHMNQDSTTYVGIVWI